MIYTPREDSYLLETQVKKYTKNKTFLDMGAANGIQSIAAIKAEAKTTLAADIQKDVITYLKNKKIPAIQSDLFSNLKGKQFDLIAFNPPYLPDDKREDTESKVTTTGGKKGDELILKFLKQAKNHLTKNGIILIVISSLTPKIRILKLLKKLSFKQKSISSKKLFMETLEVWEIKSS